MTGDKKVSELFADLIELRYSEFRQLELSDTEVTNRGDLMVKLARATRKKKGGLRAIQEVLNRLDGKIAIEIEVIYPKFYITYPNATSVEGGASIPRLPSTEEGLEVAKKEETPQEMPYGSLKAVVDKLLDAKKMDRLRIIAAADDIDAHGISEYGDPKLKSVMAAGLYDLMDYNMSAIYELLERIEGKVADKVKLLGDDVFLIRWDDVAPAGAEKNEDGVYQIAADNVTNAWAARLANENTRR